VSREKALAVATELLARRDRSRAWLSAELERRGVAADDRRGALAALERAGYLDDGRFACGRASRLAERGYGDAAIRADLERQGVDADRISGALSTLDPERERALEIARRSGASPRTARRLLAKGFAEEAVEMAVARNVQEKHGGAYYDDV
jgi:regulatory protein